MFSYSKLLGKMKENGFTQNKLSSFLGMSENTFSNKIKGKTSFSSPEIFEICAFLEIDTSEINTYFFTPIVEVSKLKT